MRSTISDLRGLVRPAGSAAALASATRRLTAKSPRIDRTTGSRRQPPVLAIGLPQTLCLDGVGLLTTESPRGVIEMLRVLDFRLLLVGDAACTPAMWNTLAIVRQQWPFLRWVLVSETCGEKEEILARSRGVTAITAHPGSIRDLARQ